MKIAIVTDWFAPRRGGIEAQLADLAHGLAMRGHEVDVITSTPGVAFAETFSVRRLPVWTLPVLDLAMSPSIWSTLGRELRHGYDVVHAHVSVVSPVGYASAVVARSIELPTIITFHSVLRGKTYLLAALDALAGIGRSAVVWTAVSSLVAGQARRALGSGDVFVLPNGIELSFWTNTPRQQMRRDVVTLASTMRLHRKKRPLQLLRAFEKAASRARCGARLRIVGDGPLRRSVEREIRKLGLHDGPIRAEVLGWLERDELRSLYAASDGFVVASKRESFGIAALEARASGLPVIAMTASGSSEFLTHETTALLCADDDQLTRMLTRFLSDEELRSRLGAALPNLEHYDWSAVLAQHEVTYQHAIKRAAAAVGIVSASV